MINSFTFLSAPLFDSPCLSLSLFSPFFLFMLSSIKSINQCKLQQNEQFKLNYFAIVKTLNVSQFFLQTDSHTHIHSQLLQLFIYLHKNRRLCRPPSAAQTILHM